MEENLKSNSHLFQEITKSEMTLKQLKVAQNRAKSDNVR